MAERSYDWLLQRPDGTREHGRGAGGKRKGLPADLTNGRLYLVDEQGAWCIDLAGGVCYRDGQPAEPPAEFILRGRGRLKAALKGGRRQWRSESQ